MYKIILFLMLGLVGCVNVPLDKKEAIDKFVEKSNKFNNEFEKLSEPKALPRSLIQFSYGPDSLKNNNFLSYLVSSNARLTSDLIKQLKDQENTFLLSLTNKKDIQEIAHQKFLAYKKQLEANKNFQEKLRVSYSNYATSKVFAELAMKAGLKAEFKMKLTSMVNGHYQGSLIDIIDEIAAKEKLKTYYSKDFKEIIFTQNDEADLIALNKELILQNGLAEQDLPSIELAVDKIKDKRFFIEQDIFKAKLSKNFIQDLIYEIRTIDIFDQKNNEASELRNALIKYSENIELSNLIDQAKTVAIFDPKLKSGKENVIEKLSVYNDTPENMLKLLQEYSLFKCNNAPNTQSNAKDQNLANGAIQSQAVKADTVKTDSVKSDTVKSDNTQNTSIASNKIANEMMSSTGSTKTPSTLITQADPVLEITASGCVTFNKDATGIIASGSITDIQLAQRVLADQDKPIKQAMVEVFILEVNSDWQQRIESKIVQTASTAKGVAFATGMTTLPGVTTGFSANKIFGDKASIQAFINLVETNSIGRKISNPLILVKDGQTGTVNKVRTARKEITSPATVSAGISVPATTTVVDLASPLTLTVTPKINKHNDNIDLNFSFSETTLDSDSVTSPTTQNQITSQLNIQPGQVVVMAGLFKETNSRVSNGLPGIAKFGLDSIWGGLNTLLGGQNSSQRVGSELLVLINPTVITNLNVAKTITKIE